MSEKRDLTGKQFGYWTVQYLSPIKKDHRSTWHCRCVCGAERDVAERRLLSGKSKSCGCRSAEFLNETRKEHGNCRDENRRLFRIWRNIQNRCYNPNTDRYSRYGGRGITVCDEWMDYKTFKEWALAHGYQDNLTIERKDVNGNYCPENCEWISPQAQARNKTNTIWIDTQHGKIAMQELCEEAGILPSTYMARVEKLGWSHERAISTPPGTVNKGYHAITYHGETHTIAEWSRITGIKYATLHQRIIRQGWSPERAFSEPVHT